MCNITVLKTTTPKARKAHLCNWCLELIEVGEKYHSTNAIGDDGIYTYKAHLECDKAAQSMTYQEYEETCELNITYKRGTKEEA